MTKNNPDLQLSAEDHAAVLRFIEARPDVYQRWLAHRQAAKAKLAAVLQRMPRNQPTPTNKKPDVSAI